MIPRVRRRSVFVRKPLYLTEEVLSPSDDNASDHGLQREMTLWDLLVIGVGGTVGTGVFVVAGLVVSGYAGTASVFSWTLAGIGCLFSAASYTELSGHVPVEGGAYAYAYHTIGELPAVVVAWLLTLEYGLSGAAVARSWGTRLLNFLLGDSPGGLSVLHGSHTYLEYIFSAILMSICVAITALGMDVSKKVATVFTIAKLSVVAFLVAMAYALWNAENLQPIVPYGVKGIFAGASASFFSYIGFDEPCMFAGEVKNPKRDIPIAMLGTVFFSTIVYLVAVFSLSGLAPYDQIDEDGAFATAFTNLGYAWAGNLVAVGELMTLPLGVLIAFLAQPRLLYIMSVDGLFHKCLGSTLVRASLSAGLVCVIVATFVPFELLDVTESAGILFAYNFTHAGVYSKRYSSQPQSGNRERKPSLEDKFWKSLRLNAGHLSVNRRSVLMNALILLGLFMMLKLEEYWSGFLWIGGALHVAAFTVLLSINRCCTLLPVDPDKHDFFMIPNWLLPWLPAVGTVFNSILVAQLHFVGIGILVGFISLSVAHYYLYAHRNSILGALEKGMSCHNNATNVSLDTSVQMLERSY